MIKKILFYGIITLLFLIIIQTFDHKSENDKPEKVAYSEFIDSLNKNYIKNVTISGYKIYAETTYNKKIFTTNTHDKKLVDDLIKKNVHFSMEPFRNVEKSTLSNIISILPHLIVLIILYYFIMHSSSGKALFKRPFEILKKEDIKTNYSDVAGIDEILDDVKNAVYNFSDSKGLADLGGKPSNGILLTGQPGTGKTLLAKAIAGELDVNFIPVSASSFVELYVGNGAKKVRKLFELAKQNSPCIIFIDEIDAIGKDRNQQSLANNDETIQTLNQLLVELDGFGTEEKVFVIAATNFHEKLDSALTRAGRFDKTINIPLPNSKGRKDIFKVHLKKTKELGKICSNLDLEYLVSISSGFTGAQIENLVNESIAIAHKEKSELIETTHFDKARDIILMGVENPNFMTRKKDKEKTAYHEAGHAIVGLFTENHDPVQKVSIIPRGQALGVTLFDSKDDRVSYSKQELDSMIQTLYGGRLAEEIIYGEEGITTGASNDLERASDIAYNMVYFWGFSSKSVRSYHLNNKNPYKDMISSNREYELEAEIDNILNKNYNKAKEIIQKEKVLLEEMKNLLIKKETINKEDIKYLIENFGVKKDYNI